MTPFQLDKYRVVKHVTRQLLKMEPGVSYFIKVEGPIFQAEQVAKPKMVKDAAGNEVPVPPPHILNVTNLETGAASQMVANEVLKSELLKQYKNDSYVGKVFELVKNTKAEGKDYNTFGITELEAVEETTATASDAKSNKK